MCSEIAIKVENLSKCYQIYDQPRDRLKQFILPRIQRVLGVRVGQYYREFWALKKVSFEIKKGETIGIIGRNGSGKSTLLQMVCGTLNPTFGEITTQGRIAALLELGSGFNPEFSGRENVYLNGAVLGLKRDEIELRFDEIAAFADIGEFIEQPVKTYSSGMMVRLAFAVIAHVDADILVIDEALAVGDAFFTQKCMHFLRNFMKSGTVLFVSHDTGSVRNLCNRAIWLEKGQIFKEGSSKEVCEQYLEAFYEAQQGKSASTQLSAHEPKQIIVPVKDQRRDFINSSNLRNDIKVFEFATAGASFGEGNAIITEVCLFDTDRNRLTWIVGGEDVVLTIEVSVNKTLRSPIIGFFMKDRLGQYIFGDNTYLSYMENPIICTAGSRLRADFIFQMPRLAAGDYSIAVAVANGTQDEHVQQHWIHDAVLFRSESSSVCSGIIGLPMKNIKLTTY